MERNDGIEQIERTRIIAIIRGIGQQHIFAVAEALLEGGVTVMEVTLNTPGAEQMIAQLQTKYGKQLFIGAGTVLDQADLNRALQAGASFIVTPNTDEKVIAHAAELGIPIFPGALSPTEIVNAWKAGATAVKIFPSASFGLNYIKELQGPLPHIPKIAVGGINVHNITEFLQAGCYAAGIGGALVSSADTAKGDYGRIKQLARQLTEKTRTFLV